MLIMSSCQKEVGFGTEATVSFEIGTPEIATRAYSDGTTATVLQYAVYDAEGNELQGFTKSVANQNAETIHISKTVNLQLTTGNTYSVIFWAAAENAPYTVDFANKTMTVDYDSVVSNDENLDAFYKFHEFTVTGAQTEIIELRRPFAQLNIGTNDLEASKNAGYEPKYSFVKVSNVYNTLDLVEGKVSGAAAVVYSYNAIPATAVFPVTGYDYLAMNYLLVASDKEVVDVEFGYTELEDAATAQTRTVGSVPVQRNHRTNIYGQLLTSDVDINIEIKPEYEEPAFELAELQKAALDGGFVTLKENVTLKAPLEVRSNMTIDLNCYTITAELKEEGRHHYAIDNYGTLTLKGNGAINARGVENFGTMIIEGNITITNVDTNGGSAIWNEGNLVINGGTFTTNVEAGEGTYGSALNTQKAGKAIVNGGTFVANSQLTYAILNYGETIINNAEVKGKHGAVASDTESHTVINGGSFELMENPNVSDHCVYYVSEIKGGTFTLGKNTDSGAQVFYSSTVAEGYKVVEKNGVFYVVAESIDAVVSTADEITDAIANATEDITIILGNDIVGNVTALQKENVKVTIIGNDKKFNGVILVDGKSARYPTTGLTIQGVEFVGGTATTTLDAYINLGEKDNDNTRYTNNVTIKDCTFAGEAMVAVKSYTGGDKNLQVIGCTVNAGMHSLLQVANVEEGLKVEGCEVYSKNGINLNNTPSLEMDGCTFDVQGYAIRFGASGNVNTTEHIYNVSNSNLKSDCKESDDAIIVFRPSATFATLNLAGTTLAGTPDILGAVDGKTTINR